MSRKMFRLFVSALLVALVITGAAWAADSPMSVKFAHQSAPDAFASPLHAFAVGFKNVLENRSGGKFNVEIFPSGTLGKEVDVMEALRNNAIQVSLASAGGFQRIFPPVGILFTPYIFRNADIAMEVVNGPFGQKLLKEFTNKTGIQAVMVMGGYTYMAISNNKRPIKTPADIKGLKFRVMDPMGGEMFKAFGAGAVPISWSELYTSLQTGVVDGQTNPPFMVAWAKFYEVQKYMTLANSQWGYQLLLCNKQWYDGLSQKEKNMVASAAQAGMYAGNGLSVLLDDKAVTGLKAAGMEVTALSDDEIKAFQDIAKPACLDWVRKQIGDAWVDELNAAIADAEKKLGYE